MSLFLKQGMIAHGFENGKGREGVPQPSERSIRYTAREILIFLAVSGAEFRYETTALI